MNIFEACKWSNDDTIPKYQSLKRDSIVMDKYEIDLKIKTNITWIF